MAVSDKKRGKIVEDLQTVLMDGEEVADAVPALAHVKRLGNETVRRGTFFVTDRRVGIFTKKLGGYDLTDFAFGLLTSVEYKKGVMYGEITLNASGTSTWVRQIDKSEVERIVKNLREKMALSRASSSGPVAASASAADEIAKLAALRDAGALSDEEFTAHKAKLLS